MAGAGLWVWPRADGVPQGMANATGPLLLAHGDGFGWPAAPRGPAGPDEQAAISSAPAANPVIAGATRHAGRPVMALPGIGPQLNGHVVPGWTMMRTPGRG